jgi:sugar phosphate isomerase/epimerase
MYIPFNKEHAMNSARPALISVMQFEEELKTGDITVFDLIETVPGFGADGIELRRELWPQWRQELEQARKRCEDLGLLVTYATFSTLFSQNNTGQSILRQDIAAAAALGSPQLRVFQGPAPADDDSAGWAAGLATVEYAAQQGIVVALENFARIPGGTLAEMSHVFDLIQHPALCANIDIGNYVLHNEDVPAAIRTLGPRAVSAHLKDQPASLNEPPTYLGGGGQDLDAIFAEFDRLPQRIIYCFEFRGGEDAAERIQRSLAFLRARW